MTRIAHLADCHVGFRQGHRCTPSGLNCREADVAAAFRGAVDGILAAEVDLVLVAGDLFHVPHPSNAAIVFAFQQFRRLRDAGLPVLLVAGNHDRPRSAESGSIMHLFTEIGVTVATTRAEMVDLAELGLSVTLVPDHCLPAEIPRGSEARQVLLVHGAVEGSCPGPSATIPRVVVEDARWAYVALGDYHTRNQVAPRAWYPGSLEFASSNIWEEAGTPKGWLLVDLETGRAEPQLVPTRTVRDLPGIDADGMTGEQLQGALAARLTGTADQVVRLRVVNAPRAIQQGLDWKKIRRWQADAVLLRLEMSPPLPTSREARARKRQTIDDMVSAFLGERMLPAAMDRSSFVSLGAEVMQECGE